MIKRKAYYKVKNAIDENRIPVLIGLRRTGKTTILKQLQKAYQDSIILTFDDIIIRSKTDLELMAYIDVLVNNGNKYIFIDEIQVRKNWDLIVKNLFDRYQDNKMAKFVVTGSSSLSFESKDTGVTRTEKILIHTLDFDEYLSFSKKEKSFDTFEYFLTYGGFPEYISMHKSIEEMLYLSLAPILNDDIPANYNININNLTRLLTELSALTNGEFIITRSSKNTGIKCEQIQDYLTILERTHIIKIIEKTNLDGHFNKYRKIKIYINPHFHI
jgi:predicted AAA+ superfamily ATPase